MLGRKNKTESGARRFSLFYGKVRIHPLFFLAGVWYSFTGDFLSFVSVALCAVLHELAHAAAAAKIGYGMQSVCLMPYGAVVRVDLDGVSPKDEIKIAIAGPLFNLALAIGFLALWWCFPSLYPYTETAFTSTLSLAVCNLLPALPLDGGRVLYCGLNILFNAYLPPTKAKKRALFVCRILSAALCLAGGALFAATCAQGKPNLSLGAFTIFLIAGLFSKKDGYVKLDFSNRKAFERGIPIKHVGVLETCTVKKALTFLSAGQYLSFDVYTQDERFLGSISQSQLSDFFQKRNLYATFSDFFRDFS